MKTWYWIILAAFVCSGGCSRWPTVRHSGLGQDLDQIYQAELPYLQQQHPTPQGDQTRVSLEVVDMPLGSLGRALATRYQLTLVIASDLESRLISFTANEMPLPELLSLIARKAGTSVSGGNGVFYLGELRPQDLAILVRRVKRLQGTEIAAVCDVATGGRRGAPVVAIDGLLVMADEFEVIRRVADLLDAIENAESCTWVVQLFLVDLLDADLRDLGIASTPAVEFSAALAGASQGLATPQGIISGVTAATRLNSVLTAVATTDRNRMVADPLFLITDGTEASMTRGQTLRVRTQTVSSAVGATTATTGIQPIQLGLKVRLRPREIGPNALRLECNVDLQDLVAIVDGLPTTSTQAWEGTADLTSGGTYLLASLRREVSRNSIAQAFRLGSKKQVEGTTLLVWGRAYRIRSAQASGGDPSGGTRERGPLDDYPPEVEVIPQMGMTSKMETE